MSLSMSVVELGASQLDSEASISLFGKPLPILYARPGYKCLLRLTPFCAGITGRVDDGEFVAVTLAGALVVVTLAGEFVAVALGGELVAVTLAGEVLLPALDTVVVGAFVATGRKICLEEPVLIGLLLVLGPVEGVPPFGVVPTAFVNAA